VQQAGAEGQIREARAAVMPQLTASVNYTRTLASLFQDITFPSPADGNGNGENPFAELPFGQPNTWNATLRLTQPLYAAGRVRTALDIARNIQRAAGFEIEEAEADVALQVRRAYFQFGIAGEFVAIAREAYDLADAQLRQVELFRRQGTVADFDVLRARVERDNLEPAIIDARNARRLAELELKRLVNVPASQPLVVTTRLAPIVEDVDRDALRASLERRAGLRALDEAIAAREGTVRIAQAARRPSVDFVGLFSFQAFPSVPTPPLSDWRRDWAVSVNLSVPVLDGGRAAGETQQAEAELRQAQASARAAARGAGDRARGRARRVRGGARADRGACAPRWTRPGAPASWWTCASARAWRHSSKHRTRGCCCARRRSTRPRRSRLPDDPRAPRARQRWRDPARLIPAGGSRVKPCPASQTSGLLDASCSVVAARARSSPTACSEAQTPPDPAPTVEQIREERGLPVTVAPPSGRSRSGASTAAMWAGLREAVVRARSEDQIAAVLVTVGQTVRLGQVLVRLSGEVAGARARQAESALQQAARNLERLRPLHEAGALSDQDWDNAQTQFDLAQADVAATRDALALTSPLTGTVTEVPARPGMIPSSGDPLVRVADLGRLLVRLRVSASQAAEMREGQPARIAGREATGRVRRIGLQAEAATRLVEVEVEFPRDTGLILGTLATIEVRIADRDHAVSVPRAAVRDNVTWVVGDDERVSRRVVTVGLQARDRVEIVSGVEAGEQVVIAGGSLLSDGARVRVVNGGPGPSPDPGPGEAR
jgi:membrane fusion protein, multidrug efflux system